MLKTTDVYQLEKSIWTEADFDRMGWHDVLVHAITFAPERYEFILDIDYIFAWVEPEPPSPGYSFWISPATLVFRNIWDFNADFGDPLGLQIMHVARDGARVPKNSNFVDGTEWTWTLDLFQGGITFASTGFDQYTRRKPVRLSSQQFSLEERGGISFARPSEMDV